MTTTDYLQREIRRTEMSIRRAERKPNTPPEELRSLHEKLVHLQEALEAMNEHWQRVHERRGWTAVADVRPVVRGRWIKTPSEIGTMDVERCSVCGCEMNGRNQFWDAPFCPRCGAEMNQG